MKITVLGGGAMGTACAAVLSEKSGQKVTVWARNASFAEQMQRGRENTRLLPGIRIPDGIEITSDLASAVENTDLLVASIPTAFLRDALTQHRGALPSKAVPSTHLTPPTATPT